MRRVVSSSASSRMPGSGGLEPRARPTPQPTPKRRLAPTGRRLLADGIVRSDSLPSRLRRRTHKSRQCTVSPARYNPHSDDRFSSMGLYAECDQAASLSRASRPRTPHKVLCILGHLGHGRACGRCMQRHSSKTLQNVAFGLEAGRRGMRREKVAPCRAGRFGRDVSKGGQGKYVSRNGSKCFTECPL